MARRHVNEFLRTTFANSGRIAGTGILYDDYSETSFPPGRYEPSPNPVGITKIEEQKKAERDTPVTTYKLTRYERIKYMSIEEVAEKILEHQITDKYCKSDCDSNDCLHELECCIRWLSET